MRTFLAEVIPPKGSPLSSNALAEQIAGYWRMDVRKFGGEIEVGYGLGEQPAMLRVQLPDDCRAHPDELIPELVFREVYGVVVPVVEDQGITE